jgi:hypothetical protein
MYPERQTLRMQVRPAGIATLLDRSTDAKLRLTNRSPFFGAIAVTSPHQEQAPVPVWVNITTNRSTSPMSGIGSKADAVAARLWV